MFLFCHRRIWQSTAWMPDFQNWNMFASFMVKKKRWKNIQKIQCCWSPGLLSMPFLIIYLTSQESCSIAFTLLNLFENHDRAVCLLLTLSATVASGESYSALKLIKNLTQANHVLGQTSWTGAIFSRRKWAKIIGFGGSSGSIYTRLQWMALQSWSIYLYCAI